MTPPPSRFRRLASLLTCVAVVLVTAADAFGRAGGGGGYHSGGGGGGGGHSSGGGHSGGGGGVFDIIWIIVTMVQHPIISLVIIAAIVLIGKFYGGKSKGGNAATPVASQTADAAAGALARLKEHDPAFDETAFLARVKTAFDKIQVAWCAQDLRTVRPFISDGVHERFTLQFAEQHAEGYRDHMENISVGGMKIVALNSPGVFDEVAVSIDASAGDWRESLKDGSRLSGSNGVEAFTEISTFLRRRGALTDTSKTGLIEGNCPNCGASIELNQSSNCASCGALLRSGTFDWVLTEITQESEWRVRKGTALPGVAALSARDPDFDAAALEDRASVIYWRKATADRVGKVDALRKVALPEFADAYAKRLRAPAGEARRFVADSAVGSVETLGVVSDASWDRAVIEIRWSGHWFVADPNGGMGRAGKDTWAAELFVLARQAGAKSDAGRSISSAHCPNCGAPESTGAANACESCGTVLNDGSRGWVLQSVQERGDSAGIMWISKVHNARETPIA